MGTVRLGCLAALATALIGAPEAAGAQGAVAPETLTADGAGIYRSHCARCHGKKGEGQRSGHDAAPRLGGNFARLSVAEMTAQIIRGGAYMPPFGALSDREIAAVASHVRTSFGNSLGPVTEEDVTRSR